MKANHPTEDISLVLEQGKRTLQSVALKSEEHIFSVSQSFQQLALLSDQTLKCALATVASLESDAVRDVLPKVQALGAAARSFFEDRLNGTRDILLAIDTETKMLRQFSMVTRRQSNIALQTSVLTMFTNIEVGRLGAEGGGFVHLAEMMGQFSRELTNDTDEIAHHVEARKPAIAATSRALSAELPILRMNFARIEAELAKDMAALESGLKRLSDSPLQFRACVDDIGQQIAQVVSAVQSHDITRQQLEHVSEAFTLLASKWKHKHIQRMRPEELSQTYAGLKIQIYQLESIKATAASWTAQIASCIDMIRNLSSSDAVGIAPMVLAQEQDVSTKLAHIEVLELEGHEYSEKIRLTMQGRSTLLTLVEEHTKKSKLVRHWLHLLSLNSIIEANHFGTRADAVFEIAKNISGITTDWGLVTEQSEVAMQEISVLVNQTSSSLEVFSENGSERLGEARRLTRLGMEDLKATAAFAAMQSVEMEQITRDMRTISSDAARSGDLLKSTYESIDSVLTAIRDLSSSMESNDANVQSNFNPDTMSALFLDSYTTQIEREIAHAALYGLALPTAQQQDMGNDVELF